MSVHVQCEHVQDECGFSNCKSIITSVIFYVSAPHYVEFEYLYTYSQLEERRTWKYEK